MSRYALIVYSILFAILFVLNGVPYIQSDGFGSFHITQCLINEQKWACERRPDYYPDYVEHAVVRTEDNKYATVYAPGAALVNLPLQLVISTLEQKPELEDDLFLATAGHTIGQGIGFLLTASILSFASIILIYKTLTSLGFGEKVALLAVGTSYASSYAIWYVLLNSGFNHTVEVFALSLFFWAFVKAQQALGSINTRYWGLTGVALGLATISRPTLAIVILPVAIYLLFTRRWRALAAFILGGVPFALLWFSYNYDSYGSIVASGYDQLFAGQNFQFSQWNGINLLFSPYRGWFVYSPLFLLGCGSLIWQYIKNPVRRLTNTVVIFGIMGTALIYGFWPMWWGGGSYGQRFMLAILPFSTLGVAYFFQYILNTEHKKLANLGLKVIVALFVGWSLLLTILYRFTPVEQLRPSDDTVGIMLAGDRYTPADILSYQPKFQSFAGGNSFVPILLNKSNSVLLINGREKQELRHITLEMVEGESPDTDIEFYFQDEKQDRAYQGRININQLAEEIVIICDVNACTTNSKGVKLSKTETFSLDRKEYEGFSTVGTKIYFKRAANLFYKGNKINYV